MAGIDPETIGQLLEAGEGKPGGGRGGRQQGLYGSQDDQTAADSGRLDPQSEFDLYEANLNTRSRFAKTGMGFPNTSEQVQFQGNRRAALAEAYNNRERELDRAERREDRELRRLQTYASLIKSGALEDLTGESGFQKGYEGEKQRQQEEADKPSPGGFNPTGNF